MPYVGRPRDPTSYDTFGRVWASTTPSVESRFAFTGRDLDPESDLYHYRARYYDPATGQFISADPIGFDAGDGNLYRYVGNGPIDGTDPSGLDYLRIDEIKRLVTDPDAWIGGTRVVGTGRGTAFWASAPSNGIRLGSARAFQVFGGGRSWKIFLDDEYGGGSISADALNSAVHLFNEKSDKPLEDFPRETQRQLLHMMLSSALSGKLGDNSAKTRALQARLWLEEHPNAGYGPPPAPPTLSGENAYRDLTRSFARTDIVVERTWRSFWKELPPKIFLGEKTVDAETSRDPRVVDPLKDRSGSDLANRLQGREQALEIANQVVNDFDKALFRTWEKDGKHFYGFYAVDEGNRPTGDLLPRVTQRRAVPGWDSPDEFRKTVGALEIMRDWLGYEPRLRVTK